MSEFTNPKSVFTTKTIRTTGLTVLLFQKSHFFFDFCLRHTLLEQPCMLSCPVPIPGAQGTLWGGGGRHS